MGLKIDNLQDHLLMQKLDALLRHGSLLKAKLLSPRSRVAPVRIVTFALLLPALMIVSPAVAPSLASTVSVLEGQVPQSLVDSDTASVELGSTFSSSEAGTVSAIRFYKTAANTGPHIVNLWSPDGKVLATATLPVSAETTDGWQTVDLPAPMKIAKNDKYVASYIAPKGQYSSDPNGLAKSKTNGPLTLLANGGVYAYGTGGKMPQSTYNSNNYFVDVVFTPTPATVPTTTPPGNVTPAPPGSTLPAGVTVRNVDGGTDYYAQFNNPLPSTPEYFPVAVWYESVIEPGDTEKDQAAGINTYIELTQDSNLNQIQQAGMHSIPSWNTPLGSGTLLPDEADMWAGAGSAAWTGNWPGQGDICSPASAKCGYTVMSQHQAQASDRSMLFANYGKGITFWQSEREAAQFVNVYPHVISDDNYWFTDPYICGISEGGILVSPQRPLTSEECRKSSNYGWTIDKVRSLVSPEASKPVWAFVEVGHPFTDNSAPTITGPQIKAAVWSSLIHGARGVIYFNHNFGGTCLSQHVLRDGCGATVLPDVAALNSQIKALAPVLNSPSLDGAALSIGAVDTDIKVHNGTMYVFAGSAKNSNQEVTISLKCSNATMATVVGENRTVPVTSGVIADSFADGNAVHIYQLNGSNTCGL